MKNNIDAPMTNRERKMAPKRHSTIVGAMPPVGIHKPSRKEIERKHALIMRKAVR